MSDQERQTQVIEDTTNPLYYEVVEMDYEVRDQNDLSTYPPFILDLFDRDFDLADKLKGDDYLARAIIDP